jgi:hypothetical protein
VTADASLWAFCCFLCVVVIVFGGLVIGSVINPKPKPDDPHY